MVIKRKVTKKKVAKADATRASTTATTKRKPASTTKKKAVVTKRKSSAAPECFSLGESIVISNVQEWHEKMLAAISSKDELVLDGSKIEQIDGTGLQLLVAFMKEGATNKTNITWKGASDTLHQNAAQLGVVEALGLDGLTGTV